MKKCLNCNKGIHDAKGFIADCKKNNLIVDKDTLEISISSGGMYVGDISDYAKRMEQKERIREKAIKIQDKMGMHCNACNNAYCIECVSNYGIEKNGILGCISCGGMMKEIRRHGEQYNYSKHKSGAGPKGKGSKKATPRRSSGNAAEGEKSCPKCGNPVTERQARNNKGLCLDCSSKACFIATATYGDYNHPSVMMFRQFRDEVLDKSIAGRALIRLYYITSPSIAKLVKRNRKIKSLSKSVLDKIIAILN